MIYLIAIILTKKEVKPDRVIGHLFLKYFSYKIKNKSIIYMIKRLSLFDSECETKHLERSITALYLSVILFVYGYFILFKMQNLIFMIIFSSLIFFFPHLKLREKYNDIKYDIITILPDKIMSLTLLLSSGMNMANAIEYISKDKDIVSDIFKITTNDIKKGGSTISVYNKLLAKCNIAPISKLSRIIILDEKNGSKKTIELLGDLNDELTNQKRAAILKRGEQASTKLLFPMMISLVGVIIAMTLPAFMELYKLF